MRIIKQHFTSKPIQTIAILFAVLVVVAVIFWLFDLRRSATLDLLVAPRSAAVTIGGRRFNNGTHRFEPGTYDVRITKNGFQSHESTITLEQGKTTSLHICLVPDATNADYYADHPEDDMICTAIGSHEADRLAEEALAKYPILEHLPYSTINYRIDLVFSDDPEQPPAISIFLNTCSDYSANIYREEALDWLKSRDIDPTDYQITFSTLCS
jgi:hypothetical protein